MSFIKYNKEKSYRDTNTGEIFTGKKITDSSFTRWKNRNLKAEWQEFRRNYSIESYDNYDFEVGFINPNSKELANFVATNEVAPVANKSNSNSNSNTKNSSTMKNLNIEMGPASGNEFKLTIMGGIAVKTGGGFSSYDTETGELTDVSGFTMDFDGAFYKMPATKVAKGDLISTKNGYGYVTKVGKNKVTVMLLDGELKTTVSTKSPFGFNFFTKIVSIFDMNGTEGTGLFGDMNPMMMMMMSNNNGGGNSPFGGDMMSMMMMSSMMGGNNDMFGGMFGGKTKKGKK